MTICAQCINSGQLHVWVWGGTLGQPNP